MRALHELPYLAIGRRHDRVGLVLGAIAVLVIVKWYVAGGGGPAIASSSRDLSTVAGHFEVATVEELREALGKMTTSGGTIRLRTGDYVVDRPLEIRGLNSVTLLGSGWACRLIRHGDGEVLSLVDAAFCEIRDLLVLGDSSARSGSAIVLKGGCSSCTIEHCRTSTVSWSARPAAVGLSRTISFATMRVTR